MSKENLNYNIDVFVIKPNNLKINDLTDLKDNLDKVLIKETLNISNDKNNNLLNLIKLLKTNHKRVINGELILEYPNYAIYLFYAYPFDTKPTDEKILNDFLNSKNNISQILTKEYIFGNAILLKVDTNLNKNISLNIDEVYDIFRCKMFCGCCIIDTDNNIKRTFISFNDLKKYSFDKITIDNTEINVLFDKNTDSKKINCYASSLLKKIFPVYGDAIIFMTRAYQDNYIDLPVLPDFINKLLIYITNSNDDINNNEANLKNENPYFYPNFFKTFNLYKNKSINLSFINSIKNNISVNQIYKEYKSNNK